MSYIIKQIGFLVIIASMTSCTQKKKEPEHKPIPVPTEVSAVEIKVDISKLASVNDTVCGMPLSDGIADTVTVNGKLYGFCNSGCKESFLASQKTN